MCAINLTRIYTRLGDAGETHLGDMSRVAKTHPRIETYGAIDELNAQLGVVRASPGLSSQLAEIVLQIQNDLFDLGADICVPSGGEKERLRANATQTQRLERLCDEINSQLPALKSFVIPGSSTVEAQLHVCRTVCRRSEREALKIEDDLNPEVVRYLNRLSDLLFILSRAVAAGDEILWNPGGQNV